MPELRRNGGDIEKKDHAGKWQLHARWLKGAWYRPTVDSLGNPEMECVENPQEQAELHRVKQ